MTLETKVTKKKKNCFSIKGINCISLMESQNSRAFTMVDWEPQITFFEEALTIITYWQLSKTHGMWSLFAASNPLRFKRLWDWKMLIGLFLPKWERKQIESIYGFKRSSYHHFHFCFFFRTLHRLTLISWAWQTASGWTSFWMRCLAYNSASN